jgi:hypothetical protein
MSFLFDPILGRGRSAEEVTPPSFSEITGDPMDNAALAADLNAKQDTLTFDAVPTNGSNNPVRSNGIFDALATKEDSLGFTPENIANKATDFGTVNNTLYPSVQAAKTYMDSLSAFSTTGEITTPHLISGHQQAGLEQPERF